MVPLAAGALVALAAGALVPPLPAAGAFVVTPPVAGAFVPRWSAQRAFLRWVQLAQPSPGYAHALAGERCAPTVGHRLETARSPRSGPRSAQRDEGSASWAASSSKQLALQPCGSSYWSPGRATAVVVGVDLRAAPFGQPARRRAWSRRAAHIAGAAITIGMRPSVRRHRQTRLGDDGGARSAPLKPTDSRSLRRRSTFKPSRDSGAVTSKPPGATWPSCSSTRAQPRIRCSTEPDVRRRGSISKRASCPMASCSWWPTSTSGTSTCEAAADDSTAQTAAAASARAAAQRGAARAPRPGDARAELTGRRRWCLEDGPGSAGLVQIHPR